MINDFKSKKITILTIFLIVIAPWHFMQSRWGLDCNLMSTMLIVSIYSLLKANHKWKYFLSGLIFGITLYTYALSYIIVPILLLGILSYLLYIKRIKIMDIILFGISLIFLAMPLILNLFVNKGWINEIVTPYFSTPKLWIYRGEEISLSNILPNVWLILKSMFGYDINDYNAFSSFGTLYYISIPLCILGFIITIKQIPKALKKKKPSIDVIFILCFISILICMLLTNGVGVSKMNAIYIPLLYFTAIGIVYIYQKSKICFTMIIIIYIILFSVFQYYYFAIYGKENLNRSFNQTTIEAVEYIEGQEKFKTKKINVRTNAIQPYIYTLIANKISPYEFNETVKIEEYFVYSYGRYIFNSIEIDENTVYLLMRTDLKYEFRDKLVEQGFIKESYKNIEIYYKTIEH